MQELIVTIVKGLVDDKDAVCVTVDLPKEAERLSTTSMSHQTIWVVLIRKQATGKSDPYDGKIRCPYHYERSLCR